MRLPIRSRSRFDVARATGDACLLLKPHLCGAVGWVPAESRSRPDGRSRRRDDDGVCGCPSPRPSPRKRVEGEAQRNGARFLPPPGGKGGVCQRHASGIGAGWGTTRTMS